MGYKVEILLVSVLPVKCLKAQGRGRLEKSTKVGDLHRPGLKEIKKLGR